MNFTRRNHYNPCFWTALWSRDYYALAKAGITQGVAAREQVVHALSVKSGNLFQTTVARIHYDQNLGVAEITREAAEDFVRRYHADQHEEFVRNSKHVPYPVFIDFEEVLTALEKLPPYQILLSVALTESIGSATDKANIGSFVVLQCLRSHAIMNSMIDWQQEIGRSKFEHFVNLKWMLSDAHALFNLVNPIVCCQWTLFKTDTESFPLCDSPVLVKPQSIMVALSPKLLLEITPHIKAAENQLPVFLPLPADKLEEYRRRTIGNTFREIVGERSTLEQWKTTAEFGSRVALMKDVKSYNTMVLQDGARELWQLNSYGNGS